MDKFGHTGTFQSLSEFVLSTDVVASELHSLDQLQLEEFPAEDEEWWWRLPGTLKPRHQEHNRVSS